MMLSNIYDSKFKQWNVTPDVIRTQTGSVKAVKLSLKYVLILIITKSLPSWLCKGLFTSVAQISGAFFTKAQDSCLAHTNFRIHLLVLC